ncbi:MAG: hypothetical protein K2H73_01395, partial [Treponemataceae bacterium]|nr:hypothetical protein [Treponemataceae bacterium]
LLTIANYVRLAIAQNVSCYRTLVLWRSHEMSIVNSTVMPLAGAHAVCTHSTNGVLTAARNREKNVKLFQKH